MQGTELHGIFEDEDEPALHRQAESKNKWDISSWDWDRICSYRTPKVVRIKDAHLGGLYWSMVLCTIMYIIVFVFHMEGKHSEQAAGIGTVITKFKGKGFSEGKVFDGPDLRFPVIEPSGAFVLTRRIMVKDQVLGQCVDWDSPRKCPCAGNGTCTGGYCTVSGWCPSIGDFNVDNPPPGSVIDSIKGLEDSVLDIQSSISFPTIGNQMFVTGTSPGAQNPFKDIKVGDLLGMAHPPVQMKDVMERGALISVNLLWACDVVVSDACEPDVVVKRLDGGQGFVQKRAAHKRVGGVESRDAAYMFGIRILVDSSGVGRRISLPLIVIQMGSCIALLRVATVVADFIMLKLYPGKDRRDAYEKCKIIATEDYSDLQDRLNLVKDSEKQKPSAALGRSSSRRAGAHVPLGLGAGGRGGMASTLIRGRSVVSAP